MGRLTGKINVCIAAAAASLPGVFGTYWYIFGAYALLNVFEWVTGWAAARKQGTETGRTGFWALLKKLGYWIIIAIAFLMSYIFIKVGQELLNLDLSILTLIGWFTLVSLLVNELRGILENLTALGYKVPAILIHGLEVAETFINQKIDEKKGD